MGPFSFRKQSVRDELSELERFCFK